mgnify:CR=1 FL=1
MVVFDVHGHDPKPMIASQRVGKFLGIDADDVDVGHVGQAEHRDRRPRVVDLDGRDLVLVHRAERRCRGERVARRGERRGDDGALQARAGAVVDDRRERCLALVRDQRRIDGACRGARGGAVSGAIGPIGPMAGGVGPVGPTGPTGAVATAYHLTITPAMIRAGGVDQSISWFTPDVPQSDRAVAVRADELDDITKELTMLNTQLKDKEANYQKLSAQLESIKKKVVYLEGEIARKEKEVNVGEKNLLKQKTLLNERAKSYYKNINKNSVTFLNLLVAGNFSTSLENFFYQKTVVDQDRDTIVRIVLYIKDLEEKFNGAKIKKG